MAFGIDCTVDQLTNGTCTQNVPETMGGNVSNSPDLKSFTTDLFGGATFFIGTVVLIALVYSGVLMVFGGADEKQLETGKKGVFYSIIGLLLVGGAYLIVRLIQMIAKG